MVFNNTSLPPRRSSFVTVLAWLSIIVSGLAMPISFITFLMVLAGSYGTERVDLLGWLTIVAGPPVSLAAGIGLLCRRLWALVYFRVLIFFLLAFDVYQIIRIFFFTSNVSYADSYQESLIATGMSYVLPALIWAWLFVKLFSRNLHSEFIKLPMIYSPSVPVTGSVNIGGIGGTDAGNGIFPKIFDRASSKPQGDWRVGHRGRDSMYYEEFHDGKWQRIDIDGEMLTGRAHHIIYFASPQRWQNYPDWACHRRDEIISRIKSQFREPDYLYYGDVPQAELQDSNHLNERSAESLKVSSARQPTRAPAINSSPRGSRPISLLPVVVLLSITAVMFWLAMDGVIKGETVVPSNHVTQQRDVSRLQEPALFWLSIGIYTVIGAGSLGLVVWGIRETCRQHKNISSSR